MVLMFRIKVAYNRPQLYSYPSLQDKLKYHPKKKLSDSRRKKTKQHIHYFLVFHPVDLMKCS